MKYVMQSLKHNGIYVPQYECKEFSIKIYGRPVKLQAKSEQMAVAWVRKAQSKTSPPDRVYYRNFIQELLKQLQLENPGKDFLGSFANKHLAGIDRNEVTFLIDDTSRGNRDIDLTEIIENLRREQEKKLAMTREEKRKLTRERKASREKLRERFGYAYVDGKKMEIANWTAEPSCLFAGRGDHPKRGKWKEGPNEEDITLNLSPDSPRPRGEWKEIIWDPGTMFLAKWVDKLFGKVKYVWFSDSAFLKQDREKEKFNKAEKLGREICRVQAHIVKNICAKDAERRKTATVAWLLLELNIRVGDEKDPEEADTVGAITLRPEHIRIEGDTLHFDFLGKDSVRYIRKIEAPAPVIGNIKHCLETCKEYLFEGIDSKKVSRFLSEVMKGLTAKVFRTWKCTRVVKDYLDKCGVKKEDAEYVKKFEAKMANLECAKVANHKRKIPPNFGERLAKKEASLKELEAKLKEKEELGKKTDALRKRIEKSRLDIRLTGETQEYNLGTSLKSYIDPNVYVRWAKEVDFSLEKFYPATLRKKYSWVMEKQ